MALLPWMQKHRVMSKARTKQSMESLARNRLIAEEVAKGIVQRLGDDLNRAKDGASTVRTETVGGLATTASVATHAVEDTAGSAIEISETTVRKATYRANTIVGTWRER